MSRRRDDASHAPHPALAGIVAALGTAPGGATVRLEVLVAGVPAAEAAFLLDARGASRFGALLARVAAARRQGTAAQRRRWGR